MCKQHHQQLPGYLLISALPSANPDVLPEHSLLAHTWKKFMFINPHISKCLKITCSLGIFQTCWSPSLFQGLLLRDQDAGDVSHQYQAAWFSQKADSRPDLNEWRWVSAVQGSCGTDLRLSEQPHLFSLFLVDPQPMSSLVAFQHELLLPALGWMGLHSYMEYTKFKKSEAHREYHYLVL